MFSDMTVVDMFKDRQYRCCGECKLIIKYNGPDWRCSRTGKKMKSWDAWHRNYVHCAEYEKLVIGEKPIYLLRHTPYFPVMTAREIEIARESYRYKEKNRRDKHEQNG